MEYLSFVCACINEHMYTGRLEDSMTGTDEGLTV